MGNWDKHGIGNVNVLSAYRGRAVVSPGFLGFSFFVEEEKKKKKME